MAYAPTPGLPPPGTLPPEPPLPTTERKATFTGEEPVVTEELPPPPKDTYPCGCSYPGDHKTDCMWSLWEQMRDNYLQTKTLMAKFMSQANSLQTADPQRAPCECPPGCHARDLGDAMGLRQMQGVTVPWQQPLLGLPPAPLSTGMQRSQQEYSVESEARKQMEEQRRIKNTWAQFLNIFDMALDLANDVSKDRWEAAKRRKERARLEREQRLEEQRRERTERRLSEKNREDKPQEKKKEEDKKTKGQEETGAKSKDKEKAKEEVKESKAQDTLETSKQDENKVGFEEPVVNVTDSDGDNINKSPDDIPPTDETLPDPPETAEADENPAEG